MKIKQCCEDITELVQIVDEDWDKYTMKNSDVKIGDAVIWRGEEDMRFAIQVTFCPFCGKKIEVLQ